jgi:hypothetical protein
LRALDKVGKVSGSKHIKATGSVALAGEDSSGRARASKTGQAKPKGGGLKERVMEKPGEGRIELEEEDGLQRGAAEGLEEEDGLQRGAAEGRRSRSRSRSGERGGMGEAGEEVWSYGPAGPM